MRALSEVELAAVLTNPRSARTLSRAGKMALIAALEAVEDAHLSDGGVDPYRIGTSMGAGGVGLWDQKHSDQLLSIIAEAKGGTK